MTHRLPDCPKCNTPMDQGFLLDKAHHDSPNQAEWLEGEPEKNFWTGLKTRGRERLSVSTYRCPKCGYLEFYADED